MTNRISDALGVHLVAYFIALIISLFSPATLSSVYDNFTGDTIDPILFDSNDDSGIFYQYIGLLKADGPPSDVYAILQSEATFGGDFEFILDYRDFQSSATSFGDCPQIRLAAGVGGGNWSNFVQIFRGLCQDGHTFASMGTLNGTSLDTGTAWSSASTDSGQLKIARSGSTITTYYNEGSGWVTHGSFDSVFTDDVKVEIAVYTGDNGSFHVASDWIKYELTTPEFTLGSQETLPIELSGTGFGEFDILDIDGTVTLNGALEVTLADGYIPSPGDSFTFLIANTIIGEFNNIILPDIGNNTFEVTINDGFAVIMVTSPEAPVTPLPVIVETTIDGALDSLTLEVEISLDADFSDRASSTIRTARADSAIYDVFVGAFVPTGVSGVSQDTWFLLDSADVWGLFSGFPLSKFLSNVEVTSQDHRLVIQILNSVNVTPFVGSTVYIGYGTSDIEMLEAGRYRSVFFVEEQ